MKGKLHLRCYVADQDDRSAFAQASQGNVHGRTNANGFEGKVGTPAARLVELNSAAAAWWAEQYIDSPAAAYVAAHRAYLGREAPGRKG